MVGQSSQPRRWGYRDYADWFDARRLPAEVRAMAARDIVPKLLSAVEAEGFHVDVGSRLERVAAFQVHQHAANPPHPMRLVPMSDPEHAQGRADDSLFVFLWRETAAGREDCAAFGIRVVPIEGTLADAIEAGGLYYPAEHARENSGGWIVFAPRAFEIRACRVAFWVSLAKVPGVSSAAVSALTRLMHVAGVARLDWSWMAGLQQAVIRDRHCYGIQGFAESSWGVISRRLRPDGRPDRAFWLATAPRWFAEKTLGNSAFHDPGRLLTEVTAPELGAGFLTLAAHLPVVDAP